MNEHHQQILESVLPDEPRSRLAPYRELILRMRRQGRTYHRIRQTLADKCGVRVAYATLYDYIKRCSQPRKPKPDIEPEVSITGVPVPTPRSSEPSPDPYAEVRERMRKHKEEPVPSKAKPLFEVPEEDFMKPLQMMQRPQKEK
jgi:hypothetical protein